MTKKKKLLLAGAAVVVALCASAPAAIAADYAAIAAGPGGASWVENGYWSMDSARNAAISKCRRDGYGSCSVSTAEESYWYFGVGWCGNGTVPYTAASPQSLDRVWHLIRIKAAADGYYDCYFGDGF